MSACTDRKPTYIYKLVPYTSPVPSNHADLPDVLPVSDLDRTSGFIHLSTAPQIPGTLANFFASDPRVYILRIPYDPLDRSGVIKWEDPKGDVCGPRPGEGLFPHVYNGLRLGRAEVESVWVLERAGGWAETIEKEEAFKAWLVY